MNHPVQQGLLQLKLRERGQTDLSERVLAPSLHDARGPPAHLLHHVQLGVLGLKKLNKQLQDLGVQELVAGADLQTRQREPR